MRVRVLTVALLGGLLASGCTTATQGNAVPAVTAQSESSPDDLPRDGAPKVEDPLDMRQFRDACLLLTSEQSQSLDLGTNGTPSESAFGSQCDWKNDTTGSDVQILILDKTDNGLSGPYGSNEEGELEVFEEVPPIEGYPAVIGMVRDIRDLGNCTISVGVRDELAIDFSVRLSRVNVGKKDPCEVTARVAGMAVQTIKNG